MITQDDIDIALRNEKFRNQRARIKAFFAENPDVKARAAMLKKLYRVGGVSLDFPDAYGWAEHTPDGMDVQKAWKEEVHLSWVQVAKRIAELIESGEYDD